MRKCSPRYPDGNKIRLNALIGREIRGRREAAKLTLRELAPAAGVSWSYLEKIETGISPCPVHVLISLANAFGCTIDDLVREAAEKAA